MFEIFVISLLRRLMTIVNFLKSIKAHVRYRAFATLQIELYHVVHYDSKWSNSALHGTIQFGVLQNLCIEQGP